MGIEVDATGNLFIAANSCIRKVSAATGIITTIAGDKDIASYAGDGPATSTWFFAPKDLLLDGGYLYVADLNSVRKIDLAGDYIWSLAGASPTGYVDGASASARFSSAQSLAKDAAGNLYVADGDFNHRIRKIDPAGNVTTIAGSGPSENPNAGDFAGDGGLAVAARLNAPKAVTVDPAGDLYIADSSNHRIRKVDHATGVISTLWGTGSKSSGDNGPADEAQVAPSRGLAMNAAGDLFFSEGSNSNRIRKIDHATAIISTFAGNGTAATTGDNGPATAAGLLSPLGIAIDPDSNLCVGTDDGIRKIDHATGRISTFVATGSITSNGLACDAVGNLYAVGGGPNGTVWQVTPDGQVSVIAGGNGGAFDGDDGPATAAKLKNPQAVAVDHDGRIFIADSQNARVRMIEGGIITTIAGNGGTTYGGDGGLAKNTSIGRPTGLAVDAAGNVYVATATARVHRIDPSGVITTVVGNGTAGFSGDNGTAGAAQISATCRLLLSADGTTLYIADEGNDRLRKVQ
jgi:sugar lactone lactonase YvrE